MHGRSGRPVVSGSEPAPEKAARSAHEQAGTWGRLQVDLRVLPPGWCEISGSSLHLLKVHGGPPVRGTCNVGRRFLYTAGDLDVIPAGSVSRWHDDNAAVSLWLRFAPELVREVAHELGLPPGREQLEPRYQFRDAQIQYIGAALEDACRRGFSHSRLYTESLGRALAVRLLDRCDAGVENRQKLSQRQLQRVTDYIEEHLSSDLGLQELAAVVQLSPSHFRALFKQSAGMPVHSYVIRRRVERARTLLLRRELPADQIALEVGFAHQSHMARCMRRVLGLTPSNLLRAFT